MQISAGPSGKFFLQAAKQRHGYFANSGAAGKERVDHDDLALQEISIKPQVLSILVRELNVREVVLGL